MVIKKINESNKVIALAGNPNVGKSTIFNELTGLRQHTGNWPGKTVVNAQGYCTYKNNGYIMVDLPGCYSLMAHSAEEEVARDFIYFGGADVVIVVCDATCLERNLNLVLQILEIAPNVIVCVNLIDEAKKKKIKIDLSTLSQKLGVPVVGTSARSKKGLDELMQNVDSVINDTSPHVHIKVKYQQNIEPTVDNIVSGLVKTAEEVCKNVVTFENQQYNLRDRKIDKILTSKWTGFPIMFLLLMLIFWLTITGANYPSQLISTGLFWIESRLIEFFVWINAPKFLYEMLVLGVYRVLAWVVSVMLPPMAIFFPLFTLLEDLGYLPRIAFNMDKCFKKCNACGKQALTMCMGFGCNAAGVVGCRIIDSPRERLIAIITNNFVPCNGRFPTLIAIISMFFVGTLSGISQSILSTLILASAILVGVFMTFVVSKFLSCTLLKGIPSSFTLELPPYRKPQIGKVIVRSIMDRTLFVLSRAIAVAAPAGLIIWILANITIADLSLLRYCSNFLDPFAQLLGLDGVILLAFILGFPANEIVVPIIIMAYMATGNIMEFESLNELKNLLVANNWTWSTAISVMIFCLMHWPCSTTCLTIKKETQSFKWTALSFALPTLTGMIICFIFTCIIQLF